MRNSWKRGLSLVLTLAMLLSLVPAFNLVPEAEAAETRIADTGLSYITLPITIRDFAADGMLFEYNEVNKKATAGDTTFNINVDVDQEYSERDEDELFGYVIRYSYATSKESMLGNEWWLDFYVNADGTIDRVYKVGESITDDSIPVDGMMVSFHDTFQNYSYLNQITTQNKDNYRLSLAPHPVYSQYYVLVVTKVGGSGFNQADTQAFGLLQTDTNDYYNVLGSDTAGTMSNTIYGSVLFNNGTWDQTTEPTTVKSNLYSVDNRTTPYATQTIYGARVRTNLVDKELDSDGKPVYTPETVAFLAEFMEDIMAVDWENDDGSYNTYHVGGVKLFDEYGDYVGPYTDEAVYDLADILRMSVNAAGGQLGSYTESKNKFRNGLLQYANQAETWFDAAYYLLHYTWRDSNLDNMTNQAGRDGYGMPIDRYSSLHLIKTTNAQNQECYVFNAKYDNTVYNYNNGEIYNTQLQTFDQAINSEGNPAYAYGNALPVARFDPLGLSGAGQDLGYGMSGDTYGNMTGDHPDWGEYYDKTNYNLTLEGNAQFVYHKNQNQYFTFTGDDDVYLYINGVRVLDIGGAHSISKVRVDLDDIADTCGMVDGGNYPFDFFFMERHGTASNFGIETNIELAVPSNSTTKTGYQDGVSTGYNGPVNPNKPVGYSFELKNDGTANIYNLTFDDPTIGVYFGWNRIQLYPTDFTDEKKQLYNVDDLYLIKYASDGSISEYLRPGYVTEAIIMEHLAEGLKPNEKIGIYGFKYKILENEWVALYDVDEKGNQVLVDYYFSNTVYTTATDKPDGVTPSLFDYDEWRVVKMRMIFSPFHVYDWVNKDVSRNPAVNCNWRNPAVARMPYTTVNVPKAKLVEYLEDNDVDVPADAQIVLCNGAGQENAESVNPNATLNTDGSITYTSTQTGNDTVFYKVKWTGSAYNEFIFNFDIYTYGTVNNIYVLDYGLAVELADPTFGFHNNDVLTSDSNKNFMTFEMVGMVNGNGDAVAEKKGSYGDFTWTAETEDADASLRYTPNKIMNNVDYTFAKVRLIEDDATELNQYTGVEMMQRISTAPASVVYYEENFPGITYVNSEGNNWVHYETVDEDGNVIADDVQSADQDSNYGSDPNYDEDLSGELVNGTTKTGYQNDVSTGYNGTVDPNEPVGYSFELKNYGAANIYNLTFDDPTIGVHFGWNRIQLYPTDFTDEQKQLYNVDDLYLIKYASDGSISEYLRPGYVTEAIIMEHLAEGLKPNEKIGIYGFKYKILENEWVPQYGVDEDGNKVLVGYYFSNTVYTTATAASDGVTPSLFGYDEWRMIFSPESAEGDTSGTDNVIDPGEGDDETNKYMLDTGNLSTLEKTALKTINKFLGIGGTDSNGSVYELQVGKTADVMHFEFHGTGFEILSRTTSGDYAVIMVQVQKQNEAGEYTLVTQKPVITQSIGGDLYQVPIISITNLDPDNYRVVVKASGSVTGVNRVLYIDGIRIYNPLLPDTALEYYRPDEYGAKFLEIKQLIEDGQALYFGVDRSEEDDEKLQLVSGNSYIEDVYGHGQLMEISDIAQYLDDGPNNELYLNASSLMGNMVAFYVVPDASVSKDARTLQIGAHRKINFETESRGEVYMTYGSTAESIVGGDNSFEIKTGTEMYYTIDLDDLLADEQGRYLLMIGTNGSEDEETLSLTNLKVKGYTIIQIEDVVQEAYQKYTQGEEITDLIRELLAIFDAAYGSVEESEGGDEDQGEETDDPTDSTDPQEAGEEVIFPEEEESEETEPEETESEETDSEETDADDIV